MVYAEAEAPSHEYAEAEAPSREYAEAEAPPREYVEAETPPHKVRCTRTWLEEEPGHRVHSAYGTEHAKAGGVFVVVR